MHKTARIYLCCLQSKTLTFRSKSYSKFKGKRDDDNILKVEWWDILFLFLVMTGNHVLIEQRILKNCTACGDAVESVESTGKRIKPSVEKDL